jgi:hypothetical protein
LVIIGLGAAGRYAALFIGEDDMTHYCNHYQPMMGKNFGVCSTDAFLGHTKN